MPQMRCIDFYLICLFALYNPNAKGMDAADVLLCILTVLIILFASIFKTILNSLYDSNICLVWDE